MMGKLTGLCVLLSVLNVALTENTLTPVYFTDGGDLTLKVRPPLPDHIHIIVWIFNDNLLAEWVEDVGYNPRLEGRATLTTETGQLIINKMSKEDEGVYSVEINDRVQSESYQAKLIEKVQKPNIAQICTFEDGYASCKFSCDSNTTKAEPVSYRWKKGDGEWKVSGKEITSGEYFSETVTCRIENPVSREESDPVHRKRYLVIWLTILCAIVLGVFVVMCICISLIKAWKKKKGPFKNRGSNITDPAYGNGDVQLSAHPSDSAIYENEPLQYNP